MMDIDELNKSQIVLLTMFVAFVSSIATGIVTVSLMQQAPANVTQTINKVVERTIEKVETVVPTQTTMIKEVAVNQEDVVADVIANAGPALFKLYPGEERVTGTSTPSLVAVGEPRGMGFVISPSGRAVTSYDVAYIDIAPLVAVFSDGREYAVKKAGVKDSTDVEILEIVGYGSKGSYLKLSEVGAVLGKTAIAPAVSVDSNSVALGIVSAIRVASASTTPLLQTSLTVRLSDVGGPVLDTKGAVIGVVTGERKTLPVSSLAKIIAGLDEVKKAQ